ncbi:myosin-IIIb [Ixodes scapularis]
MANYFPFSQDAYKTQERVKCVQNVKTQHTAAEALNKSRAHPTQMSAQSLVSQAKALQTTTTSFRFSLMDLLQKMSAGLPHFVRCLKPNDHRVAAGFSREKVLRQLRYTGVLETIYIRQQGFSHRYSFVELLKRYCFLAFSFNEKVIANRENCHLLLSRLKMDDYAIGKSKVFLKYYHVEYLSRLYEQQVRKIVVVQAAVRRWLAKRQVQKRRLAMALVTQRCQMKLHRNRDPPVRRKAAAHKLAEPQDASWKCLEILDFCHKAHHGPTNRARGLKKPQPNNSNLSQLIMTCHRVSELGPRNVQAIVEEVPVPSERRLNGRCKKQDQQLQQRPQPKMPLHLNNFDQICSHKVPSNSRIPQLTEAPVKPAPRELRCKPEEEPRRQDDDSQSASGNSSSSSIGTRPTMVEVEMWWQDGSLKENQVRQPETPTRPVPKVAALAPECDPNQGPYQFKKILRRPTPSPQPSPTNQTPGVFDFRKLLRKTDHAPTETLKRCKGLLSTRSVSSATDL